MLAFKCIYRHKAAISLGGLSQAAAMSRLEVERICSHPSSCCLLLAGLGPPWLLARPQSFATWASP